MALRAGESGLERLLQPRLGEYGIGGVPGLDVAVNREAAIGDGAVPNLMVATAMPHEVAVRCTEPLLQPPRVARHEA